VAQDFEDYLAHAASIAHDPEGARRALEAKPG
jgi:hypothetical protein